MNDANEERDLMERGLNYWVKRVFLLGGIVVLVLGVVFLAATWTTGDKWNPKSTMTFLGFTNVVAGIPATDAVFGFNGLPSSFGWDVTEVSHWDGTNWIRVPAPPFSRLFTPIFLPERRRDFSKLGSVPVGSTSAPTRVVIGLGPVSGKLQNSWNDLLMLKPLYWFTMKHPGLWAGNSDRYFMTNEFNFPPAAAPTAEQR